MAIETPELRAKTRQYRVHIMKTAMEALEAGALTQDAYNQIASAAQHDLEHARSILNKTLVLHGKKEIPNELESDNDDGLPADLDDETRKRIRAHRAEQALQRDA